MSDALDERVSADKYRKKEQASEMDSFELLRNMVHRVMMDGSEDINLLQYVQGIAANTSALGLEPEGIGIVVAADAAAHILVNCLPNQRIIVFDILLSVNAASVITFEDSEGNNILSPLYAPNAGQGFSINSIRGMRLPRGTGLFVQSTNAINYGVHCSYAIREDALP